MEKIKEAIAKLQVSHTQLPMFRSSCSVKQANDIRLRASLQYPTSLLLSNLVINGRRCVRSRRAANSLIISSAGTVNTSNTFTLHRLMPWAEGFRR